MFCTIDDLHPWSQGKGYGREAMEWLLSRAFVGYGLNRVQSKSFRLTMLSLAEKLITLIPCRRVLDLERAGGPTVQERVSCSRLRFGLTDS